MPAREFFLSAPQDWSQAPAGCKPGVSVILRTRDRPQFLERALASISAQDFADIGVCVVNDGGDPIKTEEIVRRSLSAAIAVEIVHNPTALGRPAARDLGFASVDREFFCVHDDDDAWSERFLATMVAFLREPGAARYVGVACDADAIVESMVGDRVVEVKRRPYRRLRGALSLFDSLDFLSHPPPISVLMRARALELAPRNNLAMPVMYDCEWLARVLLAADVGALASVLAFYHHREQDGDALGAARNSIFEFGDEFDRLRMLMENELLRTDFASGRLGLGFVLSVAQRAGARERRELSEDGVRFVERKAKAYFQRKTLRRRLKRALLRAIGREPGRDAPR
jgi:glycosyltransferase involved in cell wall biosynthesis